MIKKFVQGEKKSDRELFGLIGVWVASEEVHKVLGVQVTGRPGDIWHVAIERDEAIGFAQTRMLKGGEVHLRYLFPDKLAVQTSLVKAVLKMAGETGAASVFTNDRESATIWQKLDFNKHEKHRRGTFCRWERKLS